MLPASTLDRLTAIKQANMQTLLRLMLKQLLTKLLSHFLSYSLTTVYYVQSHREPAIHP